MHKLKISEGGQPIYLDDLALLQSNADEMVRTYSRVATGDTGVYLMRPAVSKLVKKNEDGSTVYQYSGGTLVIDHEMYDYPAAEVTVPANGKVYICAEQVETDKRLFDDGQERYCRVKYSAKLAVTSDGASKAYELSDLPTYIELLSETLGFISAWEIVNTVYLNRYMGRCRKRSVDAGDVQFDLDINTNITAWETPLIEVYGKKSVLIGYIQDTDLVTTLARRYYNFTANDVEYSLRFSQSGQIALTTTGDWLEGEDVDIPVLNVIKLRWKFDDMKNIPTN
jgi:hypothetical protein